MCLDRLLRSQEVANICNVSVRTVESWRYRKTGPTYLRLPTGEVRYTTTAIRQFLYSYRHYND